MNYGLSEKEFFVNVVVAVLHQKVSCKRSKTRALRRSTMKHPNPVFNLSATPAMQVHQRHVLKQIRDCDERELTDGERRKNDFYGKFSISIFMHELSGEMRSQFTA